MNQPLISVISPEAKGPSTRAENTFTGEVWVERILPRGDGVGIADVSFTAGSRTYWHTHEGGQILIVKEGEGLVGDESGTVRVAAGDTIWTPPGVRHWHGASPDCSMTHTGISLQGVEWFGPVSDEDYNNFNSAEGTSDA
jgi:quercetin dioxygenase-like cupin family protein